MNPTGQSRHNRFPAAGLALAAAALLALGACTAPGSTGSGPDGAGTGTGTGGATSASQPAAGTGSVTTVASGLETPWSIAVLPDGSALVSENDSGLIKHIVDGRMAASVEVPAEIDPTGEGGLMGLALSPEFESDQRVFVYLTAPEDNRILSYRWQDGQLLDERLVLGGIPKAGFHNGGRLKFGPDGHLYIGTGDATDAGTAQDLASLAGKVLRITPAGDPAPGNPFGDSPVYSYGHRNVQGFAWDSSGQLWISEFGPDRDDELNRIEPGGNYGWPVVTGAPGDGRFIDAAYVWPSTREASPSGMAIIEDVAWLAALRGQRLWRVDLGGTISGEAVSDHLTGEFGRLRDAAEAPDGSLWVLTNGGSPDRMLSVPVR
ncbi:PQQ-dependent sugar dehydrogenase [Arthrobacter mobilis]|uniref:PQQ-dependent sugar dehydrogenase n=1 Tax=Arthrobacter mobilis TaxID=2724944 RepID=A0A7X6HCK2_9MICC|nr:PQQ-dependent sugar dehydrogenase [Arthrobacter mobilis]NKX54643.1 PQQ-dependent sugar dehydrogenase [Arthrobacter mobilis]